MLLTELLYQRVKELGAQGSSALKPGYNAIVSRAVTLRALIVASLFPGPDDSRVLVEGEGPSRVGVGLLGRDGTPYRLLREIGAARQLHKFDSQVKKFGSLTQDDLEIASFLRVETELSTPESFARFFVVGASELPSQRALPEAPSANLVQADLGQAKALKAELEQTKAFEEAQDKLFKVQQRLQELSEKGNRLEAAERDVSELEAQLSRSLFSPAQVRELTARAQRYDADQRKHTDQIGDIQSTLRQLEEEMPGAPDELQKDPLFWGGIAGGVAIDLLAVILAKPPIALLSLIPFGAALVAALRWIDGHEQAAQSRAYLKRLGDREAAVKRTFAEDQAPLKAALKAAGATHPQELVDLFKHRDEVARLREEAKVRLETLRAEPGIAEVAKERPELMQEKQILEMTVAAQGFARPVAEIEKDLRHALGIVTDPRANKKTLQGQDPAQAPRLLLEQAGELLSMAPDALWAQLGARLASYLAALTDKRIASLKLDANRLLIAVAPDGRSGTYTSLPQPLRDQTYAALRLVLLERVAAVKKVPIFVDDAFAPLDAPKRALIHRMLKGIAAQTQVVHRCIEAPAAGLADHLVNIP